MKALNIETYMESILSIYLYANKQESIIEANLRKGFKYE